MIHSYATFSLTGSRRSGNEDAVLTPVTDAGRMLLGVADGVGGTDRGETASQCVRDRVSDTFLASPFASIESYFEAAKEGVEQLFAEEPEGGSMATTLTLCVVELQTGFAYCGHVGDTRLYHLSGAGLVTRTTDQTEAQRLVDQGILRRDQVRRYHRRNVLVSAIGPGRTYELWKTHFTLTEGDRLLLCTDGFYETVSKKEIVGLSARASEVKDLAADLERLAVERSPSDDCSVVLLQYGIRR